MYKDHTLKYCVLLLMIIGFYCGPASGQITLSTSSVINTKCDGFGCNYTGPSILINEVMIRPTSGDGCIYGTMGGSPCQGEWIELYNPDLCKSVDISCYFLGNNSPDGASGPYGGGFELPAGTIIPPRGFCVVRGMYAPAVPSNLLVQNGGRTVEVVVTNTPSVCIGGGYRLWFPNAGGWFAFYNRQGVPQDAISWNNNGTAANNPCNPPGACPFGGTLASYNNIPANRKTYILPGSPQVGLSIRRLPDGGAWVTGQQAAATYGNCNTTCTPPPVITCTGKAGVTATGGVPPYTYKWDDGQVQTNDTAVGLCGGTYCVTVFDSNGDSATSCVTVLDFEPNAFLPAFPAMCQDMPAFTLITGMPAGGSYSGPGVTGNSFNPALAGPGTHLVAYTVTNQDSCKKTVTSPITIYPAPTPYLPAFSPMCVSDPPFTLNTGFPAGGTYSGNGVSGTTFNPALSGPGTVSISYALVNAQGCDDTVSQTLIVYPLPTVNIAPINPVCSNAPAFTLTSGSPPGGTYTGTGISNNIFNPALSGTGFFPITYKFTDANGCSDSAMGSIIVNPPPPVTLNPLTSLCVGSPPVALTGGQPAGGTYSGNGIVGNVFNPAFTGPGTFAVTYTYTDPNGCTNSALQNISVNSLPVVTLPPITPVCVSSPPFMLSGGSPPGGTYSGPGLIGLQFTPSLVGPGNYVLSYRYTDVNGCTDTAEQTITVHDLPLVTLDLSSTDTVCSTADPFPLTGGTPTGGTFSGTGVTGNTFNPAVTGAGIFQVVYAYTDLNACTGYDTSFIAVMPPPAVSLSPLADHCVDDSAFMLTGGLPPGGTYNGTGVTGNTFDPALAGPGTFQITYIYTDDIGCVGSAHQQITVHPLPLVSLAPLNDVCENAAPFPLTGGIPSGGTYSGTGTMNNTFYPASSGVGNFIINYAFIDGNGCRNDSSQSVTVNPLPIDQNVTGGGYTCPGEDGVPIGLENSQFGVRYVLIHNGQAVTQPYYGNGSALNFLPQSDSGLYIIVATDTSTLCVDTMSATVQVIPVSLPEINIGDSAYLCDPAGILLHAGSFADTLSYAWSDGSADSLLLAKEPGIYWVKVSKGDCFVSDSIKLKECSKLTVPNVITPNDDNKNERFLPFDIKGDISKYHVEIFNRWGQLVYESDDLYEGWDGTLMNKGSDCSEGVYYYVITYTGITSPYPSGEYKLSGAVTLLR